MEKEMLSDYPDVLTFKQMTEILQIGKHSGLKLLQNNKVLYGRVGNKYVISKKSLIDFVSGKS